MDRHATNSLRLGCALALSALALSATPAFAKAIVAQAEPATAAAPVEFGFDPAARAAWLDDCHRRLGYRDGDRAYQRGECEAYLSSYAAHYEAAARGEPGYVYGYAPGMVPVMMVPVAPSGVVSPGVVPGPVSADQPTAPSPTVSPASPAPAPSAAHVSPVIDYAYVDTGSRLSSGNKTPQLR